MANSTSTTPTPPAPQPILEAGSEIEQCVLTPVQEKQWADTMSMMAWTAPGFRHIFFRLLTEAHNNGKSAHTAVPTRAVPIAATDARNILINPDTFFKFGLPERTFIVAHEIVHNVFGDVELLHRCRTSGHVALHDGKQLPFDNEIMQKAMDARINALLIESGIGKPADKLDGKPCGHFDKDVKGDASVLDVYKQYYLDEHPDGDGGDDPGGNGNPGGFDNVLPPGSSSGQNPHQAASQRNPSQWGVEIAAAQTIEAARSQGKMSASLSRMFKQLLEPEVSWTDYIETLINRTVGDGGYDWTQPDPYWSVLDTFSPKPTGTGAGTIIVWGDTSGSRSDQEVASNIGELAGIMEDVNPQRLVVLWCDAAIKHVDEIADPADLHNLHPKGGGGTSLEPVWDWIKEHCMGDIDLFIGFTDGYVGFPAVAPPFPVIWASSTDMQYPFGQVVRVNKKAQQP